MAAALVLMALAAAGAADTPPAPAPRLDLTPHAVIERTYVAAPVVADDQQRTEVDHRFSQGLVGQAGYLCGIGGIGPDTAPSGGGPSSLWNHQGTFLGAKLGYPF